MRDWRGCLNITLIKDKSTLKQFFCHFSFYLAMLSIFAFKEYSVPRYQVFQPSLCVSVPNVADGVKNDPL